MRSPLVIVRRRTETRLSIRCPLEETILPLIVFTPPKPVSVDAAPSGIPWAVTRTTTKSENKSRMVQDVDGRGLEFKPDSFRDPNALDDAHIQLKVFWAAKTVHREIAECTRSRSRHQAGLKFGSGNFARRVAR